uniref:Uncharacterized protein n=1 Tax=Megaselia scalaris TaxID=36166 RepID=T1GAP7_MEGSC
MCLDAIPENPNISKQMLRKAKTMTGGLSIPVINVSASQSSVPININDSKISNTKSRTKPRGNKTLKDLEEPMEISSFEKSSTTSQNKTVVKATSMCLEAIPENNISRKRLRRAKTMTDTIYNSVDMSEVETVPVKNVSASQSSISMNIDESTITDKSRNRSLEKSSSVPQNKTVAKATSMCLEAIPENSISRKRLRRAKTITDTICNAVDMSEVETVPVNDASISQSSISMNIDESTIKDKLRNRSLEKSSGVSQNKTVAKASSMCLEAIPENSISRKRLRRAKTITDTICNAVDMSEVETVPVNDASISQSSISMN